MSQTTNNVIEIEPSSPIASTSKPVSAIMKINRPVLIVVDTSYENNAYADAVGRK